MVCTNFSEFLKPYPETGFIESVWGRSCLHVPGDPDKFVGILPWRQLNRILVEHRPTKARVGLVRETNLIDDKVYIQDLRLRNGILVSQIRPRELNQKLREGYTLVINQVEEMFGPITAVAEMLESVFHERVLVNAYAAWGRSRGFAAHRDDHDVFILQLSGRKFWRIYGPSEHSSEIHGDAPPHQISWEGIIEQGDLLYIPRDWWHEVRPQGEACLHLTCGFQNRNGLDLLAWILEELRTDELHCSVLPRFASPGEQFAHVTKLRDAVCRKFDEGVLSRFLEDHDAKAVSRPHLSLPWGVVPGELPQNDDILVRFVLGRSAKLDAATNGHKCSLVADGRRWEFPLVSVPVLRTLLAHRTCTICEICAETSAELSRDAVRSTVAELLFQGLVEIGAHREQGQ